MSASIGQKTWLWFTPDVPHHEPHVPHLEWHYGKEMGIHGIVQSQQRVELPAIGYTIVFANCLLEDMWVPVCVLSSRKNQCYNDI